MSNALPILARAEGYHHLGDTFASWPAAYGRTVADAAAALFLLPLGPELLALFHDVIRQEVAASMGACTIWRGRGELSAGLVAPRDCTPFRSIPPTGFTPR